MSKQYTPPADLLLKQYIRLAQSFTDRAVPQENVLAIIASDWRYERALQGIRLLAQHHLGHLVQSLIAWRRHVNDDIKKNYSQNNVVNVQGVCKRAAMEILFLEAATQVLDEFTAEFWKDRHFQTFFESMQHVAFRWLLNSEEYVPHPELTQVRQHVVLFSGRIIGVLSRIKLSDVTNQFVRKLEERVSVRKELGPKTDQALARAQALKLCVGMRNTMLIFENDSQLEQCTRFLQRAHPLTYIAAVKKSQIHHGLCEMLTDVLTPLVRKNQPHSCTGLNPGLLADWYNQILRLKNDIGQWANKHNKHILVGYPLVTVLVCLVDNQNYNSLVDSMADFLAKQMKNKEYRSLCFKCLNQLVISSLVRNASAVSSPQVVAWLDKIVKPGLTNARKGGISMQEQQDFVADVADLNPEYCVGSIVPDLLQTDSTEAQLIALRTLHLVATSVPRDSVAALELNGNIPRRSTTLAASSSSQNSSNNKQMVQLPSAVIQDLIRSGQHPFELQGIAHLLPRVQQQIAQLLVQYHRAFGPYLSYASDAVPKDKHAQVALFSAVIRLIPYFKPEQWSVVRPLDLLPSYTAHAENTVRTSAFDALMGTVRGCPALRGIVLSNMSAFLGSVPDEAALTIRECMLLLKRLMETWLSLLQEQRLSSSSLSPELGCSRDEQQAVSSKDNLAQLSSRSSKGESGAPAAAIANSLLLDVHRLEGVLFMLLCSYDEAVRCDAYNILGLLRTLHQHLGDMMQQLGGSLPHTSSHEIAGGVRLGGAGNSSYGSVVSAQDDRSVQPAGSGGSGTGGTMSTKHKSVMSKDSLEFMLTLDQLETPEAGVTYIMDVLEEAGTDAVRRFYWDFGDWSDLWRETKHVPLDVSLQGVMSASDDIGKLRWLRCVVELARTACHMCPTSMGVAYLEMLHKLSRCLTRDASGRLQIPVDAAEGRRSEAWKVFVVVACVCPPSLRERVEKAAARKGAGLTARDLIRSLLAALTASSGMAQQVCLMALGHASPEHYAVLFEELPGLIDEYQKPSKQKKGLARPEEARKMVANVLRLVADTMPQNTLTNQPLIRSRYLDWLRETIIHLRSLPPFGETFWDVSQVAYCLCAICRCVASQLSSQLTQPLGQLREASAVQRASSNKSTASDASTAAVSSGQLLAGDTGGSPNAAAGGAAAVAGQPMTRKLLYEMFMHWCEEGHGRGNEYHVRLNAGINAALARIKDYESDMREGLKQELMQSAELLDQAARLAMAAMLQGPVFDTDARRPQGPVLYWIDRLLQAPPLGITAGRVPCVPKNSVGRTALFNLLRSNLDMFSVCVDRCYDRDPRIATGYFQVVSEVNALNPVKVEPHVVLSLVLYKMVDSNPEVREDALHMLHVLSTREWQASAEDLAAAAAAGMAGAAGGWKAHEQQQEEAFVLEAEGGSGTVVVLGALQDSYQQFQFQLASKLARDHPELSEALCEEMMTRQLELADKVSQHPVLACLGPWMENLTISTHWRGTWCERLLKSMYYVTLRHGDELPSEIENLWSKLANNRRNIIPILDFLATLGTHMAYQELNAMLEYLSVSKRICLYLARVGPQQTIEHLVYEISLELHEEETVAGGSGHMMASSMQDRGDVPLQFAAVLQYEAPVQVIGRSRAQPQPTVVEAPGLLRSSASSWWAYSSTSSLGSAAATTPSAPFPSGNMAAAAGVTASTGLLGGMLGGSGSTHGGLAASFPPAPSGVPQSSSQGPSFTSDVMSSSRAMRLSSSFPAALGNMIGGTSGTPASGVALSGLPELRESSTTGTGQSTIRRSMTDHSDSTRSSLSISGQNSTTAIGGPDPGSTSPAAGAVPASVLGLTAAAPRPINTKVGTAGVGTSGEFACSTTAVPSSGSNSLNLGTYFSTGPADDANQTAATEAGAGVPGHDEPAGWSSREADRRAGSPQPPKEPASPVLRGLVTRPELALCLLTEVAYEHDEDFSSHLALLCHVSLLLVDHEEPLVAAAAQQLLINCLYSLSARHLEVMQEEGHHVECLQATHLIKYLQSMKGRRLWSYEDLSLGQQQQMSSAIALAGLVQHCLNALSFEAPLQDSWCGVSLEWALHARSRHLACRSQQVLRALKPALNADICSTLLLCLQRCLAVASSSAVAREVALELLLTMRSLLEILPARKLLLYPQVFWSSLSLLFSSHVHLYQQAIILFSACLQHLAIHNSTAQNVLLAAAPAADTAALKQLLASCQAKGSTWFDTAKSGRSTPNADFAASGTGDAVRSQNATLQAHSLNLAGRDAAGGAGSAAAGAAVSSSIQSFVGGSDIHGSSPMHWAVGQLLPWPERGPDGPAHHMIAVQQVLFKGLLFQDTQLPTVELLSLLAKGLCQLPPAVVTPVQAPLHSSRRRSACWGSRDDGVLDDVSSVQPGGSRHRASISADCVPGSRAMSGNLSRRGSRDTPAGVGDLLAGTGASARTHIRGRSMGESLQQERLPSAREQQEYIAEDPAGSGSNNNHSRGISLGGGALGGNASAGPGTVSRSAPELRALVGTPEGADTQPPSDKSQQTTAADPSASQQGIAGLSAAAGTGPAVALNSSWGAWQPLVRGGTVGNNNDRNLPGSRAAFQSLLGHRHAQLLVSIASVVPFFCSQLGQLEPDSELFEALQDCMLTLSAACSNQGLTQLGSTLQQFTTNLNINSHLGINSSSGSQQRQQRHPQQQDPMHLRTSHGQPALAKVSMSSSTSSISLKQPGGLGVSGSLSTSKGQLNLLQSPNSPANSALLHLLQGLCLQLSRALLPTYADWLLRFWMGVLLLPGAAALHPHVLLLLRCLFDTPGLQLGPAVKLLLDSSFISPIVNLSQGALCQYALDVLDAIIQFASSSHELQQYQQQQNVGASSSSNLGLSSTSPVATGGAAGSGSAGQQGVDLHGLAACLLPQLDVVELLQRVLSSCPVPKKQQKHRLLPFLGESAVGGQQ